MIVTNIHSQVYTCISCHSAFSCGDAQKEHYRSDWHRYNLHRKVQDLPPLTETAYLNRMEHETNTQVEDVKKRKKWTCEMCKRIFSSEKALISHTKRVHPSNKGDVMQESEEEERVQEGQCFLCTNSTCTSPDSLVNHLTTEHHLYLPDLEYISDLKGLITYLQRKLCILHACLYCHDDEAFSSDTISEDMATEMLFRSRTAVINHMQDKGHCKIRFDKVGQAELAEYYNYGEHNSLEYPSNVIADDGDEEYEDVSSEGDETMTGGSTAWITPDDTELILPSGTRVGNRAYGRYYKQNLLPYSTDNIQQYLHGQSALMSRLMLKWGETGQAIHGYRIPRGNVLSYTYSNPNLETDIQARRDQQVENDARKRQELGVSTRTNKLQKHFREQIL